MIILYIIYEFQTILKLPANIDNLCLRYYKILNDICITKINMISSQNFKMSDRESISIVSVVRHIYISMCT